MTTEGNEDRYLLYLDILGFSDMVKKRRPEEVYGIVNQCLEAVSVRMRGPLPFSSLYFSDTVVLWHMKAGISNPAFVFSCATACNAFCELVAKRIPVRGAISYGQFIVRPDASRKKEIFFGKALVEAYEKEKGENWLGMVVCESAWKTFRPPAAIETLAAAGIWRKRTTDNVLLLNPFYGAQEEPKMVSGADIKAVLLARLMRQILTRAEALSAFRFLKDESVKYTKKGDFSGREAVKYHATLAFLREVLGPKLFSEMEAESERMAP
jgi:hypothetical protein